MSPTVQGVCADCWGSKGGPQFWIRKGEQNWPFGLSPFVVGAGLALVPTVILLLLWILG